MAEPLFDLKPTFDLPLTKGDDLSVRFVHKPVVVDESGDPVLVDGKRQFAEADYPDGSTVKLVIDTDPPTVFDATIDGSGATVFADHLDVDGIARGVRWRVVLTYADGLDKVAAKGKTVRDD